MMKICQFLGKREEKIRSVHSVEKFLEKAIFVYFHSKNFISLLHISTVQKNAYVTMYPTSVSVQSWQFRIIHYS
jgi:hypothetical protein